MSATIIFRDTVHSTGTFEAMCTKAAALVRREQGKRGKARKLPVYIQHEGRVYQHHGAFVSEVN